MRPKKNKKEVKTEVISLKVTYDFKKQIIDAAKEENRSMANFIENAIAKFISDSRSHTV